jgi:hypothetical protein
MREERQRRLELNTSAINILNSLEYMGYSVVTSGSFVASQTNNNKVSLIRRIIRVISLTMFFYIREANIDLFKKNLSGPFIVNPMSFNKKKDQPSKW